MRWQIVKEVVGKIREVVRRRVLSYRQLQFNEAPAPPPRKWSRKLKGHSLTSFFRRETRLRVKYQPYDWVNEHHRDNAFRKMENDMFSRGTITLLAPRSHGLKFVILAAILILGTIWLLDPGKQLPQMMNKVHGKKVPLEAHIM